MPLCLPYMYRLCWQERGVPQGQGPQPLSAQTASSGHGLSMYIQDFHSESAPTPCPAPPGSGRCLTQEDLILSEELEDGGALAATLEEGSVLGATLGTLGTLGDLDPSQLAFLPTDVSGLGGQGGRGRAGWSLPGMAPCWGLPAPVLRLCSCCCAWGGRNAKWCFGGP